MSLICSFLTRMRIVMEFSFRAAESTVRIVSGAAGVKMTISFTVLAGRLPRAHRGAHDPTIHP